MQAALLQYDFAKIQNFLEHLDSSPALQSQDHLHDLRGRTRDDDMRDYLLSTDDKAAIKSLTGPFKTVVTARDLEVARIKLAALRAIVDSTDERVAAINDYWVSLKDIEREDQLWRHALQKDLLALDTPHAAVVIAIQDKLRRLITTDTPLKDTWKPLVTELVAALIEDRSDLARRIGKLPSRGQLIEYHSRSTLCTPPATVAKGNPRSAAATATTPSANTYVSPKLRRPAPDIEEYYPASSKHNGQEGVVIISMNIDTSGCAISTGIAASSGADDLDAAAIKYSELLYFEPANRGGKSVAAIQPIALVFKLERD